MSDDGALSKDNALASDIYLILATDTKKP